MRNEALDTTRREVAVEHLTVRETCRRLRCSRWTLDRRFREGELTKVKSGRTVLIPAADVTAYLNRKKQPVAEAEAA